MDDIRIATRFDLKRLFNLNLFLLFRPKRMLMMVIVAIAFSYALTLSDGTFSFSTTLFAAIMFLVVFYTFFILLAYFSCRNRIRKIAHLTEVNNYTITTDKIDVKSESYSSSVTWQYIKQMVEREDYFLLMISTGTFHHLDKRGFESKTELDRFKNLVGEKGIKITYH